MKSRSNLGFPKFSSGGLSAKYDKSIGIGTYPPLYSVSSAESPGETADIKIMKININPKNFRIVINNSPFANFTLSIKIFSVEIFIHFTTKNKGGKFFAFIH